MFEGTGATIERLTRETMKLKDAIEKLTAEVNAKQARLTELEKLLDTSGAELMRYRKRYGWLPSQEDKALPHDA